MASEYNHSSHYTYLLQYHIVWCPKFRYSVLKGNIEDELKTILREICERYNYEINALEVMPDHVHIFVKAPQTVAPCDIARTLKSISAIELFKRFPKLKQFYGRCGVLWSRSYFIATAGEASAETIKKYIEEQKGRD